jgi:cobalt-zinc-cadmium efflux system outer membrane protein
MNARAVAENYRAYRVNLIGQVRMTYYSLWALDRKIEIQTRTLTYYENLLKSVNVLNGINRASQADQITVTSEIVSIKTQILGLQRQRESELYKINKLLGRELSSTALWVVRAIGPSSPGGTGVVLSLAVLEQDLIDHHPALRQMNRMIEMNTAMLEANNDERAPDLMVQAMVMRAPRGMILTSKTDLSMLAMEPQKTEYMYSVMASITLPFAPWSSGKIDSKNDELLSSIKALEYEREDMKREMIASLRNALVKLRTAEDMLALYGGTVIPLYEETIKMQVASYQNNQTTITTLIETFRMHLMHEMNYYMAQADYYMSLAEIEMMMGIEHLQGE